MSIFSVTLLICSACSSEAVEISAIFFSTWAVFSTTALNELDTFSASSSPLLMAFTVFSISAVVREEASPHFEASCPTSSATTEKPFPAPPAEAASIDALSARMWVWKAISLIASFIERIYLERSDISFMALYSSPICSLLILIQLWIFDARSRAFAVFAALVLMLVFISSKVPLISFINLV